MYSRCLKHPARIKNTTTPTLVRGVPKKLLKVCIFVVLRFLIPGHLLSTLILLANYNSRVQ